MLQNPRRVGQFGEWKIMANVGSVAEAQKVAVGM